MEVAEAKARLEEVLLLTGFSLDIPVPQIAWVGFEAFAREPVACAHDGLLFQCGVFDFGLPRAGPLFYLDFVRQFSIDVDGEYDHMEQLHCEFSRPPAEEVRKLNTNLWLEKFNDDYDAYFAAVEALPEFQRAIRLSGWKCKVSQELV